MTLMTKLSYEGPNAQQIEYWNEQSGPKWVALQTVLDEQIAPLGRRAMDAAAIAAGAHVIDVGCGCGQTTLELARRVGPTGSATGFDISHPMLERARQLAREQGVGNAHFEDADAQTHPFEAGKYDLVFSRFGIMFFADSVAAFRNLARALKPGGRIAFVCWRSFPENPWVVIPMSAALPLLPTPPPLPDPDAPGPFRFADPDKVKTILGDAGFANANVERLDATVTMGGSGSDLDTAVGFLLQIGPAAAALRDVTPDVRERVFGAVKEALAPYHGPKGVQMDSASWIVTASKG